MSDIYKEGAALANGASAAIADFVSDCARDRFKKAFHETLYAYLHGADEKTRAQVTRMVDISRDSAQQHATLEDFKAACERALAQAAQPSKGQYGHNPHEVNKECKCGNCMHGV